METRMGDFLPFLFSPVLHHVQAEFARERHFQGTGNEQQSNSTLPWFFSANKPLKK